MCSELKINTAWHGCGVFIFDFDHSQHINIVFLFLTLNKYLTVGCERQVIMFWKHKKPYICFLIKSPISFSGLSLHLIEINYEHMTKLWTYNERMFQLWFCFRNLKLIVIAISQKFNLFCCIKPKTYLNYWNSETN